MCGGISYQIGKIPRSELDKYFSEIQIKKFEKSKQVRFFFWDKNPVLPIDENKKIKLIQWGNRSDDIKLPKTGWAKAESIKLGKWKYLNPKPVKILAQRGYEKGVWFEIEKGIYGIEVEENDQRRVYMITKPATKKYLKLTKHNREPVIIK